VNNMSAMFDRMGRQKAAQLANNQDLTNKLSQFIGPANEGAAVRLGQTERMLANLTNLPSYLKEYGTTVGMSDMEMAARWRDMVSSVATGGSLKAGLEGAFEPMDTSFTGSGGFMPPSTKERFLAKYEASSYITSNLTNPSTEFAQQMVMASVLPIAKEMIPNTVATKAFITDSAVGELSKPYVKKRRFKAYQQGLAEESSKLMPSEIQDYETLLVTPREWKRSVSIDMKYIETMNFDVPADILADAGREMQVLIDQAFFRGLDQLVPNDGAAPAAGSTPNGFKLNTTKTVMTLEQGRNPQVEDINFANQLLRDRGYNPDLIITSPYELAALMSQQAVLMAYAYGTREVQETGLVGTLVGNAVAWTPNLWQGGNPSSMAIWVVDSDELARIVLGWPISLFPDFRMRRMDFELYARLALFFRNTNSCVKIVCDNADPGIV
jgi:hypothetical protein